MIALARWQGAVPHRLAARPHTWQPDPLQPTPLCCLACLPHTSWLQRRLPPAVLALRWLQQQQLLLHLPDPAAAARAGACLQLCGSSIRGGERTNSTAVSEEWSGWGVR